MAAASTSGMAAKSENPSICIPFVFSNITWQRVKGIFEELELGEVERVDLVRKTAKDGKPCKRAFIHFTKWGTSADATKFRTDILQGKQVKVVYDEPWFWLCSKSNVPRPERRQRKHTPRVPPHIESTMSDETPRDVIRNQNKTIAELTEQIEMQKRTIRLAWGAICHDGFPVMSACADKYHVAVKKCVDEAHEGVTDLNDVFRSDNSWGARGERKLREESYGDSLARRWAGYEEWLDEDGDICCGFPGKESGVGDDDTCDDDDTCE